MKFVAAVLTLAAVATAAPAEVVARTNPTATTCGINGNNNGKVTCCNSAIPIIGQLLCNIAVLGSNCNVGQSAYCCKTDANVSLLSPGIS